MIKVKVPSQIKLLTHTYHIKFDPKILISAGCGGLTRHTYQDIILDNALYMPSELNQTLLHELIHLIERHFTLKFDDADVDRLAQGLAVILFDNLNIELDWSDIETH